MLRRPAIPFSAILLLASAVSAQPLPDEVEFNRHVRPILAENCLKCHGPDSGARRPKSKPLRLDRPSRDFPRSALVRRITSNDPDERMPPPESGKSLTQGQVSILEKWVAGGARYEGHWAFLPPQRRPSPAFRGASWPRNAVDAHILARLDAEGLEPSPEADRGILIRRLSFDLTGLPPAPEEIEAFRGDSSPGAYERLVDRLLASPHYGERVASHWLDLVRYADSNGYHADLEWSVSPYRDWVIRAFNDNMPFDRFTREQLAGDLLPGATIDQQVASGYNRLNMKSTEFGIQDKEYLAKYASDRVRTTTSTWLGMTLGCAECHDHKFDPLASRDFYRFAAFFADLKQMGYYPDAQKRGWGETVVVPDPRATVRIAEIDSQLATLQKILGTPTPALAASLERWEASRSRLSRRLPRRLPEARIPIRDARHKGHEWRYTLKKPSGDWQARSYDDSSWLKGTGGFGTRSTPNTHVRTEWKSADIWLRTTFRLDEVPEKLHLYAHHDEDANVYLNGYLVKRFSGYSTKYVNVALDDKALDALCEGDNLVAVHCHQTGGGQYIDLGLSEHEGGEGAGDGISDEIRKVLEIDPARRDEKQRKALASFYRTIAPGLDAVRRQVKDLNTERKALLDAAPTTLVSVSVQPRVTRVLARGDWMDASGEVVEPGVPAFFRQIRKKGRASRLDLADWLTAPDNPLTARVFVNRLWRSFFGTGLSKVLDDLGFQGEWPTHPALLDRLAMEFVESGWDVKHVVRLLVVSSAYRQSSLVSPRLREIDPYNRLLARQSRFRLDAEAIRDNALAASGLLVRVLGGRSVKPYQPAGYWDHLYFPKRSYKHDTGAGQYRRALYTHWQRQFLHPALKIFDAPPREECTAERPRSNTPLAALALLNDPSQVEAARVLATRAVGEGGQTSTERLQWIALRVLSRRLDGRELNLMEALLEKHREKFAAAPRRAKDILTTGLSPAPAGDAVELAAWTSVVRVFLNLHETITRN